MTPLTPKVFRFKERLRVRWAEIDAQRIVFNAHYLQYLDTAMAGYWRALALPYAETLAHWGGDLFVRHSSLDYHAPAAYDDMIEVGLRCDRVGRSSITFDAQIERQGRALVSGTLVYVYADPQGQEAREVPTELRDVLAAFEQGDAMVSLRVGRWSELGQWAQPLRMAVFVEEQKIPANLSTDAADADAVHAVAQNRLGLALATGRLLSDTASDGRRIGRIGRMASRRDARDAGHASTVLNALIEAARARGDAEVRLHAQTSAEGFYLRHGFQAVGERFVEAGLGHVEMVRALAPG